MADGVVRVGVVRVRRASGWAFGECGPGVVRRVRALITAMLVRPRFVLRVALRGTVFGGVGRRLLRPRRRRRPRLWRTPKRYGQAREQAQACG